MRKEILVMDGTQTLMVSLDQRWILDPRALNDKLFDTPSHTGRKRALREILESEIIPLVFFDVRADADSIYGHHKVHLGGVIDL
jgi:exonuclease 3'-5' domain-containing protein 1